MLTMLLSGGYHPQVWGNLARRQQCVPAPCCRRDTLAHIHSVLWHADVEQNVSGVLSVITHQSNGVTPRFGEQRSAWSDSCRSTTSNLWQAPQLVQNFRSRALRCSKVVTGLASSLLSPAPWQAVCPARARPTAAASTLIPRHGGAAAAPTRSGAWRLWHRGSILV